ncbi:MAG: hypothetical protein INH40_21175 [Acidobacteriaceae bacterium]|jgi:hypothetical protein|nr:hypothetical protein [Acidobacteriaceae bacterium]
MICLFGCWLLLVVIGAAPAIAGDHIGAIEFFGYYGIDVPKMRRAIPVHEGDEYTDRTKNQVRQAVAAAIGKGPTDVAAICCDEKGNRLLFVGLAGTSKKSFAYNPKPKGNERLPSDIMVVYGRLDDALEAAVRRGGDAAEEDDSSGYALVKDPATRSLQLAVRQLALKYERELMRTLEFSSAAAHRRVASDAIGYTRRSREQILALVRAARDPDDEVRNNATRALGVLVRSKAALAAEIPPDTFIEMLNSGKWTDRNKATSLLLELTAERDAILLRKIRSAAQDSLTEMASWRRPSHAFFARMVLGRVVGIPEARLKDLAWNGPVDEIVEASGRR